MKIDHVGIAVDKMEEALALYQRAFGLTLLHREDVPSQGVRVAFLGEPGCDVQVELLEPTAGDGAVARFLRARGPGMHHLAFRSAAIEQEMSRLRAEGKPPLEDQPRAGARGHRVCFLHPKQTAGTLIEIVG